MRRIALLGALVAALILVYGVKVSSAQASCVSGDFYYAGADINAPSPGQSETLYEGIAPGYGTYGYVWPSSYGHVLTHLYAIVSSGNALEIGLYNGTVGDGNGGYIASGGVSTFAAYTTNGGVTYTIWDGPDVSAGQVYQFKLARATTNQGTIWTSYYGTQAIHTVGLGSNSQLTVGADTEDAVLNAYSLCDSIDGIFDNSTNAEYGGYCTPNGAQCGWNSVCGFSVRGVANRGWESYASAGSPWWGCHSTFICPPQCSAPTMGDPTYGGTWAQATRLPKGAKPPPKLGTGEHKRLQ